MCLRGRRRWMGQCLMLASHRSIPGRQVGSLAVLLSPLLPWPACPAQAHQCSNISLHARCRAMGEQHANQLDHVTFVSVVHYITLCCYIINYIGPNKAGSRRMRRGEVWGIGQGTLVTTHHQKAPNCCRHQPTTSLRHSSPPPH